MIAIIVLTPILLIQSYGIFVYNILDTSMVMSSSSQQILSQNIITLESVFFEFLRVVRDILPIIATIFIFQYLVLKKNIPFAELKYIIAGMGFVIL